MLALVSVPLYGLNNPAPIYKWAHLASDSENTPNSQIKSDNNVVTKTPDGFWDTAKTD
jgi:hypothetical protein